MIKGKALPPVETIAPPTQQEIDGAVILWDANCPPYYVGLLDADSVTVKDSKKKFLYDKARLVYIVRKTGRELSRREVNQAFVEFNKKVSGQ
jgi:hypothetical protein